MSSREVRQPGVAECTGLLLGAANGPGLPTRGLARSMPGPTRSRSTKALPGHGPGAASELGPTPDRARAQTWPEASPYHSQGTLEKVLVQPDQSIKTLLLHGNYYLRKAWL